MRVVPLAYLVLCFVCFAYSLPVSVIRRSHIPYGTQVQHATEKITKCEAFVRSDVPVKDLQKQIHDRLKDALKEYTFDVPEGKKLGGITCYVDNQKVFTADMNWSIES
ncbi:hypothetical protein FB446DRAFT_756634 [Lentinula raphanica]|nr:hypothetical protein FB446DRAFT_756634 [Lentinula raphanica]KAJ3826931.1 hypothetical protein F5880DRAFT_1541172 [Lentinula raphanica]